MCRVGVWKGSGKRCENVLSWGMEGKWLKMWEKDVRMCWVGVWKGSGKKCENVLSWVMEVKWWKMWKCVEFGYRREVEKDVRMCWVGVWKGSGKRCENLLSWGMERKKFDQDWPTGFRDIQVQKCEIFVTQGQVTPKWVVWFGPKSKSSKLLCLS